MDVSLNFHKPKLSNLSMILPQELVWWQNRYIVHVFSGFNNITFNAGFRCTTATDRIMTLPLQVRKRKT